MLSSPPDAVIAAPCPTCRRLLHLTPELHGCVISCRSCHNLTAVIAENQIQQIAESLTESADGTPLGAAIPCPRCDHELHLTTNLNGRFIRCRSCSHVMGVVVLGGCSEFPVTKTPPLPVPCPRCAGSLLLRPSLLNSRIQCRTCKSLLHVTGSAGRLALVELLKHAGGNHDRLSQDVTADRWSLAAAVRNRAGAIRRLWYGVRMASAGLWTRTVRKRTAAVAPTKSAAPAAQFTESPRQPEAAAGASATSVTPSENPAQSTLSDAAVAERADRAVTAQTQPATRAPFRLPGPLDVGGLAELGLAAAVIGVVLAAVIGIVGIGWWLFTRPPVIAAGLYLPLDSQLVVSTQWSELAAQGFSQLPKEWPGALLTHRIRYFAQSADLKDREIERVTAGGSADGSNLVAVYYLAKPIKPEQIADREQFSSWRERKSASEWVWGSPVYHIEDRAIAFPDPRVIVNGTREQVREVLKRGSGRFRDPLAFLLQSADFAAMNTTVSSSVQGTLLADWLANAKQPVSCVIGTMISHRYGATMRFSRTLHVTGPDAANGVRTALESGLRAAVAATRSSRDATRVLESAKVTATGNAVQIELEVPAGQMTPDRVAVLNRLF